MMKPFLTRRGALLQPKYMFHCISITFHLSVLLSKDCFYLAAIPHGTSYVEIHRAIQFLAIALNQEQAKRMSIRGKTAPHALIPSLCKSTKIHCCQASLLHYVSLPLSYVYNIVQLNVKSALAHYEK